MGKSKDLATGETRFVNTSGDTMTGNLAINNASGSQVTLHRTDTTIANDDLLGQVIISGDDADTNASGTRGFIRGRSQGTGGGLKMEFGTAGGGVAIGDPRMTINADGIVTKPYHPSFSAYINGGNPTITSNPTKIPYNAVRWDIGNNFDETNHRYIAPVAGVYHFTVNHNVYGLTDDQYFRTRIYVNAASYALLGYIRARGGGDHTVNDSILINLSVADTVEVYTSSADTSYSLSAANNWNSFSGFLVG